MPARCKAVGFFFRQGTQGIYMSSLFHSLIVIVFTLSLVSCGGKKSPASKGKNTDIFREAILGHWVSDCYLDNRSDPRVNSWAQKEYWFYETETHNVTTKYNDSLCKIKFSLQVIDESGVIASQQKNKATYYFYDNQIANSGLSFSMYRATNIYQKSPDPFFGLEWNFGVYIQENTLYLANPDFEYGSGFKIDFDRPFYKKSE
jgi:hypothetical protein